VLFLDAGIVDHDVEPAELLHRLRDQALYLVQLRNVRGHGERLAAGLLDVVHDAVGRVLLVAHVVDRDRDSFARHGLCHGLPNARGRTRNDRHFPL